MLRLETGEKVLFIGDSITHCDRETTLPPLGWGFVRLVDTFLAARHPAVPVEIVNRGVGGDTILDLERRWERDAIAEDPDWLFVMIGVNDLLFRYSDRYAHKAVGDAAYEAAWHRLLQRTRAAARSRTVIIEPAPPDPDARSERNTLMRPLLEIIGRTARAHGVEVCPVYDRFLDGLAHARTPDWLIDVPHPALKGHALIALAVLEHLGW